MSGNRVVAIPARFYVWLFRGTPLLVQLVLIYTCLPQLGLKLNVLTSALTALGLNEAAKALGLSRWRTLRLVLAPQVARLTIPALGNSFNGLLKATSLASVISLEELMRRSQVLMQDPGVLRSHLQVAPRVRRRNRATARTHRMDVELRQADHPSLSSNVSRFSGNSLPASASASIPLPASASFAAGTPPRLGVVFD